MRSKLKCAFVVFCVFFSVSSRCKTAEAITFDEVVVAIQRGDEHFLEDELFSNNLGSEAQRQSFSIIHGRLKDGRTLVHLAAAWGRDRIIRKFLDYGVDRYSRAMDGTHAIHDAVGYGHLSTVKVLLFHRRRPPLHRPMNVSAILAMRAGADRLTPLEVAARFHPGPLYDYLHMLNHFHSVLPRRKQRRAALPSSASQAPLGLVGMKPLDLTVEPEEDDSACKEVARSVASAVLGD